MKNENLIPNMLVEDETKLPKRGGKYVSDEAKEKAKAAAEEAARRCYCDCNCDCDNDPINCNC